MNTTLNKIQKFGKVTNILVTIFLAIACITTIIITIAGLYLTQCKDISVVTDNKLSFKIKLDGKYENFDYVGKLEGLIIDIENIKLKDFKITKEDNVSVISCNTQNSEYTLKDLDGFVLFTGIQSIAECISIFMLKKICKYLRDCDSFFTNDLINTMFKFMYSLIPIFVLSLFIYYYKTRSPFFSPKIDFNLLVEISFIYIIITIFKYGVKRQAESDETL